MKLTLPAVDEPLIRVLVLTHDGLYHLDFHGERPQEVDIAVPDVDMEKARIGYVGLTAGGEEVGEPALLYEPPEPKAKGGYVGHPDPARPVPAAVTLTGNATVTALPNENLLPAGSDKPKTADTLPPDAMRPDPSKPSAEASPETVKVEEKVEVKTTRKK